MTLALRILSLLGIGAAIGIAVYTAASGRIASEKRLGLRGLKRRRALERSELFASVEPWIRLLARWAAFAPIAGRERLEETLKHAGDWLGLDPEEFAALCALAALAGGAIGGALVWAFDLPGLLVPFLSGLGAATPYISVTGEVQRRAKTIDRALPGAIDLAALCMTAGLSFPQALEQIIAKSGGADDPLNEEIALILHELRLGWTRQRALENFADRVPSQAVRSFAAAVVQSEQRGTPLVEILQIQATTLRQRRSASGEEAASRAAVLMLIPLMLILSAIIVLLMGPFVIQGWQSGF